MCEECRSKYLQFKEGVCNLQHENMGMVVLVADQYAFASSSHAVFRVVLFEALQPRKD